MENEIAFVSGSRRVSGSQNSRIGAADRYGLGFARISFHSAAHWQAHDMSSPGRSLPIELTIADPIDLTSAGYHRHFRQVPGVEIKKGRLVDVAKSPDSGRPYDVLLLPMPNCHGVAPSSGIIKELFRYVMIQESNQLTLAPAPSLPTCPMDFHPSTTFKSP